MIKSDIRSNIHSQPWAFLEKQVEKQLPHQVERRLWKQVRNIVRAQVDEQFLPSLYAQLRTDIDELTNP